MWHLYSKNISLRRETILLPIDKVGNVLQVCYQTLKNQEFTNKYIKTPTSYLHCEISVYYLTVNIVLILFDHFT